MIGPHNEGARLVLECETQGGYPEPSLSWWRDGRLVDDSYEIVSAQDGLVISQVAARRNGEQATGSDGLQTDAEAGAELEDSAPSSPQAADAQVDNAKTAASSSSSSRLVRNRLELGPLTRNDLMANYSCRAPNSRLQAEPPSNFVMIDMNRK